MNAYVQGIIQSGSTGTIVQTECHLSNGLPAIVIVGLGGKAVDEAKERIRSAFASSGIQLPRKRITINLAPADIPKEGTGLDLPIATSILQNSNQFINSMKPDSAAIGELGLDGTIRPVRGIIGKIITGKKLGIINFFIPYDNLDQALLVPGISIFPIKNLHELSLHLAGKQIESRNSGEGASYSSKSIEHASTLDEIIGQDQAKRAAEIAAAGGHNLFLNGPPGTGKSMLAKSLPTILPPLSQEEVLEITHLYSLANGKGDELITERPFRSPHHTSSLTSLVGGGHNLRPGEISLSHRGILFLDELPEFNRSSIEALRQPLEDRMVTIARAKDTASYPAHFILVATANPCPCGYYGTSKECSCSMQQVTRYKQKMSGPIMDRFDLYVNVENIDHSKLLGRSESSRTNSMRQNIEKARTTQTNRYKTSVKLNADMSNRDVKEKSSLSEDAKNLLNQAAKHMNISARSYMRIIKVSRTIADLDNSPQISPGHVAEALQYRPQTAN